MFKKKELNFTIDNVNEVPENIEEVIAKIQKETFPCETRIIVFKSKEDTGLVAVFVKSNAFLTLNLEGIKNISQNDIVSLSTIFENNKLDDAAADAVVKELISKNISVTTMESCTSGLVASTITNTPGASAIFKGADITYSNEAKAMAGVDSDLIDCYGVYSKEVASAMAHTCKLSFDANIGIGVTGTTSNLDPNNSDSIMGVIYYSIQSNDITIDAKLNLDTTNVSKKAVKEIICANILETLRLFTI